MASDMKPGEIGILQNIQHDEIGNNREFLNGYFAEVLPDKPIWWESDYCIKIIGWEKSEIRKDQIRPLQDPGDTIADEHSRRITEEA